MTEPKKTKMDVNAFFGDADHRFTLNPVEHLRELQEKTGVGPMALFRRLYSGNYDTDDIREIIRVGLVGGGLSASEAHKLVKRYIDAEPLNTHAGLALEIMGAALFGVGEPADASDIGVSEAA